MKRGRHTLSMLGLVAMLLAPVAPRVWARSSTPRLPELALRDLVAVGDATLSEVYRGTWRRRTWYFKRPLPGSRIFRSPNFEAEWVVGALLRALEMPGPRLDLVRLKGREGTFLATQGVTPDAFGGVVRSLGDWIEARPRKPVAPVDRDLLIRLLLLDLLTGNGDRHPGNLLLVEKGGRQVPVPIDHDLALSTPRVVRHYVFLHATESFRGGPVVKPGYGTRDFVNPELAARSGTALSIALANPLYRQVWSQGERHPDFAARLAATARRLVRRLPDRVLEEAVGAIPEAAFLGDEPGPRREEILRILKRRRDLLPSLFLSSGRRLGPRERSLLARLEKVLEGHPEVLRGEVKLGLSPGCWQVLGRRLAHEMVRRPEAAEVYAHLRDLGLGPEWSREVVAVLVEPLGLSPGLPDTYELAWQKRGYPPLRLE